MFESSLTISTTKKYTLDELYALFEAEGKFEEPYELITKKTLTKHIRFPGLSKTAIEVYPAFGDSGIVVNLTKENRGKDFALSMLTDGWNDVLSNAPVENAPLIAKITEEIKRLDALGVAAPEPSPAAPELVVEAAAAEAPAAAGATVAGAAAEKLSAIKDKIKLPDLKKEKADAEEGDEIFEIASKGGLNNTKNAVDEILEKMGFSMAYSDIHSATASRGSGLASALAGPLAGKNNIAMKLALSYSEATHAGTGGDGTNIRIWDAGSDLGKKLTLTGGATKKVLAEIVAALKEGLSRRDM